MSFIAELKRRRVFRAGMLYLVVAWGVMQASDLIAPRLGLPDWTVTLVIVLAGLGFPIALILAWLYDLRPDPARPGSEPVPRRAIAYLGIGIIIALVGFAAYSTIGKSDKDATATPNGDDPNAASVAVLPFVNMSADKEQEYFSDGLTEELLNALAQVSGLRVAARTSSFSFKGKNLPIAEVARALNVKTVVEGSVRKAGNRVRITAQLINAANGFHLWSQTFDRELTDIFAIQEEISRAITDALKLELAPRDSASLSREQHDLSAYDLYLRARYLWSGRTAANLREARSLLERAIAIDPNFARAHVALADVATIWNDYAERRDPDAEKKAVQSARRALQLDSTLAEAYAALGSSHYRSARWSEADAAFKRGIALNPSYAPAHQWYAWMLLYYGKREEALRQIQTAVAVDPLSLIANENLGEFIYYTGRYRDAIAQFKRTLQLDSTFAVAFPSMAVSYSMLGVKDSALLWAERTLAGKELNVWDLGQSALVFVRAGQTERAREVLREMERRGLWEMTAGSYVTLGDTAQALSALEKAYAAGATENLFEQLTVSPATVALRQHPRVKELRRKLGLAQ